MDSSLLVSRNHLLAAGFGLIELMIALTLGTVIILGIRLRRWRSTARFHRCT